MLSKIMLRFIAKVASYNCLWPASNECHNPYILRKALWVNGDLLG